MSESEKLQLVDFALEIIEKRVPVMIGINYNDTKYASEFAKKITKILEKYNFDQENASFLVNNPSYNKPSENGIFAHFKEIHDSIEKFPMLIYNIPSRSIFDLKNEFLKKIFIELDRVIGIKDCSSDLNRVFELKEWASENLKNKKLNLFCGDDILFLPHFINGGCGVISVCSNLFPEKMSQMSHYLNNDEFKKASEVHLELMPLFSGLFIEPNPAPVKFLMNLKFGTKNLLRLPLMQICEKNEKILQDLFSKIN
jgi:4-hydroxy-tetrahydrodipicolinate synthase